MKTIYDIGMYDGSDTEYYLENGYRVIAVEANPELVENAKIRFKNQITTGKLICINAAISHDDNPVTLTLSGTDLGSSTVFPEKITHKKPIKDISVMGITIDKLFKKHGIPKYMKVDIEGADRYCVLPLTIDTRPSFLSFEIGEDVDQLLSHLAMIGYNQYKIVNQNSFRAFENNGCLFDRISRRIIRHMGYAEPRMIKRAGRFFVAGHSSGPLPWLTDGRWRSLKETQFIIWNEKLHGWNDIHATIGI